MNDAPTDCQISYDAVADEYTRRIFDELDHKPLDRQLLDRFAQSVPRGGLVCDLGCGPGQVARYLHERSVNVCGVDLSPAMVEQARRLTPGVPFQQGDMTNLTAVPDGAWAGIAAFYSLIHISPAELPAALAELHRVLQPNGLLHLSFHIGDETIHRDEWFGQSVNVDFYFFQPDTMAAHLTKARFAVEDVIEREPYPDVEHPTRRAYIFARRTKGAAQ